MTKIVEPSDELKKHQKNAWNSWVNFIRKSPKLIENNSFNSISINPCSLKNEISSMDEAILSLIKLKLFELNIFLETIISITENKEILNFSELALTRVKRRGKEIDLIIKKLKNEK